MEEEEDEEEEEDYLLIKLGLEYVIFVFQSGFHKFLCNVFVQF